MCQYHPSRRELLQLSALFSTAGASTLLSLLAGCQKKEPDAPVRIGYLPITDATPLLVAHHNGYFDENGLRSEKPVLLRSWAQVIEAFLAGKVNVIHLLSPMTVWARFGSKVPAKVVAWNHVGGSGLTVAPRVQKVADLGGKTVAIPFWYSVHNVVLQALLRENGLTPVALKQGETPAPNQVNLVVLAPPDMPPALASGRVEGYIVAEPFNAAAEAKNIGKILRFTGDVWRDHACCVVFMHERDLEQRPEWSQKVVDAIVKAQLWTREHREQAAELLATDGKQQYTPHPSAILKRVLAPAPDAQTAYAASGAIQHADWNARRIDFQPYPYPSYTEELVRRLKETVVDGSNEFLTSLEPQQAARELVDDRFVRQALQSKNAYSAFGLDPRLTRAEQIAL